MTSGGPLILSRGSPDPVLNAFAADVGVDDPVCVVGGTTQWEVGGLPSAGARRLAAPVGIVSHQPAELIVRVRAGTTVGSLDAALAEAGQMVPLDPQLPERATVGGVLAVGRSGPRRLRYGPARDTLLEARFVMASGRLVTAGGPVVKNVTGYDLCRLLVGSLGTLGLLVEVVLRCQPVPAAQQWLVAPSGADPFDLYRRLFRPSSILWDGDAVWVLLEGHPADVADQADRVLGPEFAEAAGPPALPSGGRLSVPPARLTALRGVEGTWLAEVGVGTVHTGSDDGGVAARLTGGAWGNCHDLSPRSGPGGRVAPATGSPESRAAALHDALKARFDPTGRLNPGRRPW